MLSIMGEKGFEQGRAKGYSHLYILQKKALADPHGSYSSQILAFIFQAQSKSQLKLAGLMFNLNLNYFNHLTDLLY